MGVRAHGPIIKWKTSADTGALLAKVWRMQGEMVHILWHPSADYSLDSFTYGDLKEVKEWENGKWVSHVEMATWARHPWARLSFLR